MTSHRKKSSTAYGFTLVELMIAVTVSSLIGLGVISTLHMLSTGTTAQQISRKRGLTAVIASNRVGDQLRYATKVLGSSDTTCVLWAGDTNGDTLVNLSEITALVYEQDTNTLQTYAADPVPTGMSDTGYALSSNFVTLAEVQIAAGHWSGQAIASEVQACSLDSTTQPDSGRSIVRLDLTFTQNADPVRIAVALRGSHY